MDQTQLARMVLSRTAARDEKFPGTYLSSEQANAIIDDTIDHVGRYGDAVTYKYLLGHKRRLAMTLTLIPKAESSESSCCLDVGCFGYMAFWAWRYLGYSRVEGIELLPEDNRSSFNRTIAVGSDKLELTIHNFDLSHEEWPITDHFDTILFLETLEHINHDPMGVMMNVVQRMSDVGTLVMSVPNSISYKCLGEFMSGMPPWNYWFYNPDLRQEPRHCFEYTPFVYNMVLHAAGLEVGYFQTMCAFVARHELDDLFAAGQALSIEPALFGDTLIAQARKLPGAEVVRYPDCIYDSDRFYKSTYPVIEPVRRAAIRAFISDYIGRPTKAQFERATTGLNRAQFDLEAKSKELSEREATIATLRQAVSETEGRYAQLNEQFFATLEICERLLSRLEQNGSNFAVTPRRPVSSAAQVKSSIQIELAKFLCTIGFTRTGTGLWNSAKKRLE